MASVRVLSICPGSHDSLGSRSLTPAKGAHTAVGPTPILRMGALMAQAADNSPSSLDTIKTVVDVIGTAITALAVIIGGVWAYFKFVKGRTYRPRLEPGLSGEWRLVGDKQMLQARITAKNIGASKFTLLQKGTGLRISVLARDQSPAPAPADWTSLRVFEVFREHQWIEPGETVCDDLLLNLGTSQPVATLFEARLVCRWSRWGRNIDVFARRVIAVDSTIGEREKSAADAGRHERRAAMPPPPPPEYEDPSESKRWDADKKRPDEPGQELEDKGETENWERDKDKKQP
jgi:hypothetical protein